MMIEEPHGYLLDADGRVVCRFGNWDVGDHEVPDAVESVEYVDGANSHTKAVHEEYQPEL